jgi:hypothetical protein
VTVEVVWLPESVAIGQTVHGSKHPVEVSRGENVAGGFRVPVRLTQLQAAEDSQVREQASAPLDRLQVSSDVEQWRVNRPSGSLNATHRMVRIQTIKFGGPHRVI